MTGGGDLDEFEDEATDVADEDADVMDDDDVDEAGGTGDGEADAPVGDVLDLNENDPDPTAGASDVGGVPGGVEPEPDR
ncbi:MAG TPA: hypothetical protein VHS78_06490 [Candidatus Elarobacter sp.]|jgi:hypothetical protein|nr:hypothetical protein [Candidatus Elarobacter sp.]